MTTTAARSGRPQAAERPKLSPGVTSLPVRRFTLDEYHRMSELGFLREGDPYELLNGWITHKMTINPPHAAAISLLARRLDRILGDTFVVRVQSPVTIPASDSEPEPDIVIAMGPETKYNAAHPHPHQVVILVEVADSTLATDRGQKLAIYAAAKIAEYWIVNLVDRQIEVYTAPRGGKNPIYRTRTDYGPDDSVRVTIAGREIGAIAARDILP
ncbi:Uma2 family endonuclease [Fimbriiglobus ruber]|uniref:Putative dioxygenase n=1 Tax=Fimbriiglobus ruber TaxID=1908690 RepID=A0A225D956_9BACT|nr:Uma2 family endonuclease [Fimbriiglobus ruber]OWK37992.1 putative dioxygenase [Fimbriiglobus ruber]